MPGESQDDMGSLLDDLRRAGNASQSHESFLRRLSQLARSSLNAPQENEEIFSSPPAGFDDSPLPDNVTSIHAVASKVSRPPSGVTPPPNFQDAEEPEGFVPACCCPPEVSTGPLRPCCESETGGCYRSPHAALLAQAAAFAHLTAPPAPCTCCAGDINALKRALRPPPLEQPALSIASPGNEAEERKVWGGSEEGVPQTCGCSGADVPQHVRQLSVENKEICPCKRERLAVWTENLENIRSPDNDKDAYITKWVVPPPPTSAVALPPEPGSYSYWPESATVDGLTIPSNTDMKDTTPKASNASIILERLRKESTRSDKAVAFNVANPGSGSELPPEPERPHGDGRRCLEKAGVEGRLAPLECVDPVTCKEDCVRATVPVTFELPDVPVTSYLLLDESTCSDNLVTSSGSSRLSSEKFRSGSESFAAFVQTIQSIPSTKFDPFATEVPCPGIQASKTQGMTVPETVLPESKTNDDLLMQMGASSSGIDIPKQASSYPLGDIIIPPPPAEFSSTLPTTNIDDEPKIKTKSSAGSVIVNVGAIGFTLDNGNRLSVALSDSDEKILLDSRKDKTSNILDKFIKHSLPTETRRMLNIVEPDAIELEYMAYIKRKICDRNEISEDREYIEEQGVDVEVAEHPMKLESEFISNKKLSQIEHFDLVSSSEKNKLNNMNKIPSDEKKSTETNMNDKSDLINLMEIKEIYDTDVSETYPLDLMPPPPEYEDSRIKTSKSVEKESENKISSSNSMSITDQTTEQTTSNILDEMSNKIALTSNLYPKVNIAVSERTVLNYKNELNKITMGIQVSLGDLKVCDVNNNFLGFQKASRVDFGTACGFEMVTEEGKVSRENVTHFSNFNEQYERGNQFITDRAGYRDGGKEGNIALKSPGVSTPSHAEWIPTQGTPEIIHSRTKLELFVEYDYEKSKTEVNHAQFLSGLSDSSSGGVDFEEVPVGETREVEIPVIMDGRKKEQPSSTYNEMKDCTEQASTQNVENNRCLSKKNITQGVDEEEQNSHENSPFYQKVKYKRIRKSSKSITNILLDTEEYTIDTSTTSFREVSDAKKINTLYMTRENSFQENDTSLTWSDFGSFEQSSSSHSCYSENSSACIPLTSRGMNTSSGNLAAPDNVYSGRVSRVNMSEEKSHTDLTFTEVNETVFDSQHLRFSGLNDVRLNVFVPETDDETRANENCNEKYHDCNDFEGLDTLVELNNLYQISFKKYIADQNNLSGEASNQSRKSDTVDEKCEDSVLQMSCNTLDSDSVCLHQHIEKCPILQLPGSSKLFTSECSVFHNVGEILGKFANEAPKVFTLNYWPQRFQDMVHCTQEAKQKIGDLMKFVALYGLIQCHPNFQNHQSYQPITSSFSTFQKASTSFFSSAGTLLKDAVTYSSKTGKKSQNELPPCSTLVRKYGKCKPAFMIKGHGKDPDVVKFTANGGEEKEDKELDGNLKAQLCDSERKNTDEYEDHHLKNPTDVADDDASYLLTSAVKLYALEKDESHLVPTDESDVRRLRQNEGDSVSDSTSVSYFSTSDVLITCAYVDDLSFDGRRVVFQVNDDKEGRTFRSPSILRKHMMVSLDDDSDKTGKTLDDITIDTEKSAFSTKESFHSADTRWNKHSKVIPPDKLKDIAIQLLKKHLERRAIKPTSLLERDVGSNITHMKIFEVYSHPINEGVLEPSQDAIEPSTDDIPETVGSINLDSFVELAECEGSEEKRIGVSDDTEDSLDIEIASETDSPSLGNIICVSKNSGDVTVTPKSTLSKKMMCSSLTTDQCTENESTCTIVHALPRDRESANQATNDEAELTLDNVEDENPSTLELSNRNNYDSSVVLEDCTTSEELPNLLEEKPINREYLQAFPKEIEHYKSHDFPRVSNEDTIKLAPFIAMENDAKKFNTTLKEIKENLETSQEVKNKSTTNFQRKITNLIRFSTHKVIPSENLEVHSSTDFITPHTSEECSTRIHQGVSKHIPGIVESRLDSTDKLSTFVLNSLNKCNEKSLNTVNIPDVVLNEHTGSISPNTVVKSEQGITVRRSEAECGQLVRIEEAACDEREREEGESEKTEAEMELEEKRDESEHKESLRDDEENEVDQRGVGEREGGAQLREEDAIDDETRNAKNDEDTAVQFVVSECQDVFLFAAAISEEEQLQLEEAERLQLDAEQLKTNAERLKSEAARLKSDTERLQSNLERLQVETPIQNTEECELTNMKGTALENQRRHDAAVAAACTNDEKSSSERSCSELDAVTSQLRADLQDLRQRLARKSHEMKMMHQQLVVTEVGARTNSMAPHENLPVDCYTLLNSLLSLLSSISITIEESSEIALANLPPPPPPPPPLLLLPVDPVSTETVHSSSPTEEEMPRGTPRHSSLASVSVNEGTSTDTLDVARDREDRSLFEELLSVFASHKQPDSSAVKKSKSQPTLQQPSLRQRNAGFSGAVEQKKANRQRRRGAHGEFLRRRSISEEERPSRRREFEERLSPWEELADNDKDLLIPGTIDWNPRRLSTVFEEENVEDSISSQEEQKGDILKIHQQKVSKQQQKCVSEAAGDTSTQIVKEKLNENCSSENKYAIQRYKENRGVVSDECDSVSRAVCVTMKHKTELAQWSTGSDNLSVPNVESIICRELGGYGETIPFLKRTRRNVMLSRPVIVPIFDEVVVESAEPSHQPVDENENASENRKLIRHQTKSDDEIQLSKGHREEYGCCACKTQFKENISKNSWLPHTCYKMFASLCNVSLLSKYFSDNKENDSSWGQSREVPNIESSMSLPAAPRWLSTEVHSPSAVCSEKTVPRSRRKKHHKRNRSTSLTTMPGCETLAKSISGLPAELRPLDAQSLLLRWPVVKGARGYEIFLNGELKQKVYSGTRDQAALLDLDLSKEVQVTVLPRMSPGFQTPLFYACATFTPPAEATH